MRLEKWLRIPKKMAPANTSHNQNYKCICETPHQLGSAQYTNCCANCIQQQQRKKTFLFHADIASSRQFKCMLNAFVAFRSEMGQLIHAFLSHFFFLPDDMLRQSNAVPSTLFFFMCNVHTSSLNFVHFVQHTDHIRAE